MLRGAPEPGILAWVRLTSHQRGYVWRSPRRRVCVGCERACARESVQVDARCMRACVCASVRVCALHISEGWVVCVSACVCP